ncbi:hypothetical protein GALL_226510 [mine drainage metagenome]|uniref:O-antigen ligase n=1 Tax=mine drainage metagenome TaxID=410659 RepID=A0A1J5RTT0_9ZZZZ
MAHRFPIALLTLSMACGAGLIFLAHPLFSLGAWGDGQPMAIGLMTSAGCGFLALAALPQRRLAARALQAPLCLAAYALAAVTLAAAPFTAHPWRSLFGPPETGQGLLWWLALAGFTAQALVLRQCRRPWRLAQSIAVAGALCAAMLGLQGIDWLYPLLAKARLIPDIRFLVFNEYLAYDALALLVLASLEPRRAWALFLAGAGLAVLLVSRNRTAFASFPAIVILAWALRARWRPVLAVPLVLLAALAPLGIEAWGGIAPLWSRGLILRVALPALPHLAGHGWGAFPDVMIRHLPAAGVPTYQSQWGGIGRDLFHSHNALLEGALAAGPLGGGLAAFLPAAAAMRPRRNRAWIAAAFALGWATLDGFWFEIAATPPFLAMAAAALAARPARRRWRPSAAVPALLGLLLLTAAALLWRQAAAESRLAACLTSGSCPAPRPPSALDDDRRGLASLLETALQQDLAQGPRLAAARAGAFLALQRRAEALPPTAPVLSMALLNATAAEAFAPAGSPLAWSDPDQLAAAWDKDARRLLAQAPRRLDVLPPYLDWCLTHGRTARLAAMLALAGQIDPDHPVVLWFTGIQDLQSPSAPLQARGLALMRRAYTAGLERFMPVSPALKRQLKLVPPL